MVRAKGTVRWLVALGVAVAAAVVLVIVLTGSDGKSASASTTPSGGLYPAASQPRPLATYTEHVPHVASQLNIYGYQGSVKGAPSVPPETLKPLSPSAFARPVTEYRAYSGRQLELMAPEIARLQNALKSGDRAAAQDAWRDAYGDYMRLGAVYLEGPVATLDQAIDGNPGGLPGGTSSPQFTGLHRIEYGLWTGQPPASLEPYASRLQTDVAKLRKVLPGVQIVPLDYATRAHEILEDAVRDLLSGTDVPWSGAGVLATESGLMATREVIKTLSPMLQYREAVLPVVTTQLDALSSTLASLKADHGGTLPSNSELSQTESERLNASIGDALEALAQVPGALETAYTPAIPQIPANQKRIVP
jgi:high-affinity iron transporter